jgi:hypothetical protein
MGPGRGGSGVCLTAISSASNTHRIFRDESFCFKILSNILQESTESLDSIQRHPLAGFSVETEEDAEDIDMSH